MLTATKNIFSCLAWSICLLFSLGFAQAAVTSKPLPKLSVQLHSVKTDLKNNFTETLIQIADMGVSGVEFAGFYGPYQKDPAGLKLFLSSLGLQASGAHIPLSQLQGQVGERNIAFFKELDVGLVIIPHDKRIDQANQIDHLIVELIETSKRLNKAGMKLAYHNHAKEFKRFNGASYWDYLAKNTPDNFVLQLDVGWANFAKVDPNEYVVKYPNRTLTSHFKIRTYQGKPSVVSKDKQVIIGQGNFDWLGLIKTMTKYGGTQWIVIEQEEYPQGMSPIVSVKASVDGLKKFLETYSKNHKE